MKLAVTGGGTGGHVFPALELALEARSRGWEVCYLGSLRGQESRAADRAGIPFRGFPSEPLYSLKSPRGWKAAFNLYRANQMAKKALRDFSPDVLVSTGGYASAPVANAAGNLGIPYVLHEQNTVPGRTNRLLSKRAFAVATVFRSGAEHFAGCRVERTGMPIRKDLRDSAQGRLGVGQGMPGHSPILLVMGGSQGALALNDAALATAVRMASTEVQWLHVTGMAHFDSTLVTKQKMAVTAPYEVKAYLEAEEMASALFSSSLAICRSGAGTIAELAAFRKPAILVPYPHAFGNHQLHNAKEMESIGAATVLQQADLQPSALEGRIQMWLTDGALQAAAVIALAEWDIPDAVQRILKLVEEAAA